MPITSVRDNENNRWKRNEKKKKNKQANKDKEEQGGDRSSSERVRAEWFCCAFKLGLLQLICKV